MSALTATSVLDVPLKWLGRQRWLRYGLRSRVLGVLADPIGGHGSRSFEAPFAGFVYPGNLSRWIDWIVYYHGAYELDELELARDLVKGRSEVLTLDIGANVGHHTLFFASFSQHVHAFEPYDGVGDCVQEKITRNALKNVTLHRIGLGEADQELAYYAPQGSNIGTGTFVATHEQENNRLYGTLRIAHADAYLAALNLPRIDLVKIDVEGFELSVLRGMREALGRHRPVVMMELSDSVRATFPDLASFMALLPPDYQVHEVLSRQARWGLFGRRGCRLRAPEFEAPARSGHYINLLLRPDEA